MARTQKRGVQQQPMSVDPQADAPANHLPSESESQGPDFDLIARRAYERYQMRGSEHGRDQEDWLEAERELTNGHGARPTSHPAQANTAS